MALLYKSQRSQLDHFRIYEKFERVILSIWPKKGVQVFKLVTKNSFDERINQIIKKASLLSDVIIQEDFKFMKEFY